MANIFINAKYIPNQVLVGDDMVAFNTVTTKQGCGIVFVAGGNAFTVKRAGVYEVDFDTDLDATATGEIPIQIIVNGNAVSIATADATSGTVTHLHVKGTIRVLGSCRCINNNAVVQIQLGAGATLSNADITITRV